MWLFQIFLSLIGQHCPNIRELDIAGADIVTDFGIVWYATFSCLFLMNSN